jgi:hypothetical protein
MAGATAIKHTALADANSTEFFERMFHSPFFYAFEVARST